MRPPRFLRIAVPAPLLGALDYLPPDGVDPGALVPGQRLEVDLGARRVVGVLLETSDASAVPAKRLRRARRVLDAAPELPLDVLELTRWAAEYYRAPIGEALATVLPVLLRAPKPKLPGTRKRKAPAGGDDADDDAIPAVSTADARRPALNDAQAAAVSALSGALGGFAAFLLEGVTGSGKTEVYLQAAAAALARGTQVLVLVPEIALTPQLIARFRARLEVPVLALHSGLADGARLAAWRAARDGSARVVLGTRSAVFTPLCELGLIVVDEEHDPSFKQQDGFRYNARDLAVVRAQRQRCPIVLGSATPALESLANVADARYRLLDLPERAGGALHPKIEVIDVRKRALTEGLSEPLLARIRAQLASGGQSLLFLNRRGFAPRLTCHDCGWMADCRRCDARLVTHRARGELRCHHCGAQQRLPTACPDCGSAELRLLGRGTERLDDALAALFPDAGVLRVDRDTTRRKGSLEALLADAQSGRAKILVGTQMLAKGHDFPNVTLVGIVEADHGLFGADFRAAERMAQLITQVSGRAGRADRPGEVLIQTRHPEHPLLAALIGGGYPAFAEQALVERQDAGLPPYAALALLRAEAATAAQALEFLGAARTAAESVLAADAALAGVELMGPAPAPMERRAGRFRAQLLLRAVGRKEGRARLHALLAAWSPGLATLPEARRARWSLDVDPQELV
jgi:primosomal protein N' (replication factor Y)